MPLKIHQKLLKKKTSIKLKKTILKKINMMMKSSLCMKNNTSFLGHKTTLYIYLDLEMV